MRVTDISIKAAIYLLVALSGSTSAYGANPDCDPNGEIEPRKGAIAWLSETWDRTWSFYSQFSCRDIQLKCRIAKREQPIEIAFVSEEHRNLLSVEVRKGLLEAAVSGKVEVLTEVTPIGAAFNWSKKSNLEGSGLPDVPTVRTLDSPVYIGLTHSYRYRADDLFVKPKPETSPDSIIRLMRTIADNPLFRGAYEKIRAENPNAIAIQNIDSLLKIYAGLRSPIRPDSDLYIKLHRFGSDIPPEERDRFAREMHVNIVDLAKANFPKELEGLRLPHLETPEDALNIGLEPKDAITPLSTIWEIHHNRRSKDMAVKVAQRLCEPAQPKLPLVIIAGEYHFKEMSDVLSCLSAGKVKLKEYKSFDSEGATALGNRLKIRFETAQ